MNFSGLAYNLRKSFKNALPITKFPLSLVYFNVVNGSRVNACPVHQKLRKITNAQGDDAYTTKSGVELLVPHVGVEDVNNNIVAVRVGEGDFRYVDDVKFDEEGKQLIISMQDDETMKYQFANACKEAAIRYRPEEKWYNTAIIGFVVFCIACILIYIATTTSVGEQLSAPVKNLGEQIKNLGSSVGNLASTVGKVSGGTSSGFGVQNAPPT